MAAISPFPIAYSLSSFEAPLLSLSITLTGWQKWRGPLRSQPAHIHSRWGQRGPEGLWLVQPSSCSQWEGIPSALCPECCPLPHSCSRLNSHGGRGDKISEEQRLLIHFAPFQDWWVRRLVEECGGVNCQVGLDLFGRRGVQGSNCPWVSLQALLPDPQPAGFCFKHAGSFSLCTLWTHRECLLHGHPVAQKSTS